MMINTKILGIVIVLIVIGVVCIGEGKKTAQPITETLEALSEILGRGEGISSVKYDMITTGQGIPPTTLKVWLKKNKMRTEIIAEGERIVNLIDMDRETMYQYIPATNMAIKMDFSMAPESPIISTEKLKLYDPVVTGTEIIDGKVCIVFEYTAERIKTKCWIWKEKGFPLRVEAITPEGKVITEYKNIEFVDIPDSMFEFPAGVQILEIPVMF